MKKFFSFLAVLLITLSLTIGFVGCKAKQQSSESTSESSIESSVAESGVES